MHPAYWISRLLEPLRTKLNALAVRGVVKGVDNAPRCAELRATGLAGQVLDPVELFQQVGFTSNPPPGAEHATICLGGDRGRAICIATSYREARPTDAAPGEAILYAVAGGAVVAKIAVRANGEVEVTAGKLKVSGDVEALGDVGDGSLTTATLALMRQVFNAHTHAETGGTTAPPSTPM